MTEERKSPHASRQALIQYSLGELTDEVMKELEDHLAGCDTCAARSAGMRRLATIFDRLPERVAPAPDPLEIAKRIWAALSGARDTVSGVLGLVGWNTGGSAPSLSAEEYRSLALPSSPFSKFAPAPRLRGSVKTRGAVRTRRVADETSMEAGGEKGQPKCTIVTAGAGGKVVIRLEQWVPENPPPLCLIMPQQPGGTLVPQLVEWEERESMILAEWEAPPGSYIVALVEGAP